MPAYSLPGTEVGPTRARIIGVSVVTLSVLAALVWRAVPDSVPADQIHVTLITSSVGEGVASGTDVRLDGVRVGSVDGIVAANQGRQRVELDLEGAQLFGLTDALTVEYAPGNLFGISSLQLHPGEGGTVLANGTTVDLTGHNSGRVTDATLSALLKSAGALTGSVLTPQLTQLLAQLSRNVRGFSPLLQAMGTTARSFVETQQLPPSVLLAQYGAAMAGLPSLLSGGLAVLQAAYTNQYFQSPEHMARYSQMFGNIQTQLLPAVVQAASNGKRYFGGFMPILTAILERLASSVSTPERSAQQLSDLLDRVGAMFHDTAGGPVVNAHVELELMPGLSAPLAALLDGRPAGGDR